MGMKALKPIFWIFALVFGIILDVYLFLTSVVRGRAALPGTAVSGAKKVNPNKMLFIGCGGFIE